MSLTVLTLCGNKLTSLPAEIGQLTELTTLYLTGNKLTTLPAAIRELWEAELCYLEAAGCHMDMYDGVTFDE